MKPFVRPKRVANAEKERTWKEMTFLTLTNEENDNEDDERDLILDAHDTIVAGRMEREGDEGVIAHEHDEAELPAPLDRSEIFAEQKKDEFCQAVLEEQVGRKGSPFFEDDECVLCRQNLREPGHDQVLLPKSLRHRVLRLANYHFQSGHPGKTRMHKRVRRNFY